MLNLAKLLGLRRRSTPFEQQEVALIIADIGGYTEFMLSTQTSLLHGQMIINELIQAIIEQVQIPLKVAKLEGDAVFLYAVKDGSDARWQAVRRQIGDKLMTFFDAFSDKLRQLGEATPCTCDACVNIGGLRLKAVLHTGIAAFYKLGDFTELAGVDVIIVHRLLKNSVPLQEYILLTEAAFHNIPIPKQREAQPREETYPAIGTLRTYLYPIHHHTSHADHHH
jgi:class 3 adenylate cyclase